jgi:hypothetical protein
VDEGGICNGGGVDKDGGEMVLEAGGFEMMKCLFGAILRLALFPRCLYQVRGCLA